jgi:hypothetical protein
MVDGKPQHDWPGAARALLGKTVSRYEDYTVANSALRAGDKVTLIGLEAADLPPNFDSYAGRVTIRICYASVFDDSWLATGRLAQRNSWQQVKSCPAQADSADF